MSRVRWLAAAACALLAAACSSPEATRQRGQAGADIGNRNRTAQFHAGAGPYHAVACVVSHGPCDGPLPVFGHGKN